MSPKNKAVKTKQTKTSKTKSTTPTTSSFYAEHERILDSIREMELKRKAFDHQRRKRILQEWMEYEKRIASQM